MIAQILSLTARTLSARTLSARTLSLAIILGCWRIEPVLGQEAPTANDRTITVRADHWFPMNGEPASGKPGYMIELAMALLRPAGFDVEYKIAPWKRALHDAVEGNIDCVVGATEEEADKLITPKLSWGLDISAIYVKAHDPWRVSDMKSLLSRRTGLVTGYDYGDRLNELFQSHKSGKTFQFASGHDPLSMNITKLLSGKLDGVFETTAVMDAYLTTHKMTHQIINAGELGPRLPLFIACSPAYERTRNAIHAIDASMPKFRQSGRLQKLLDKYGLKDWEK